MKMEIAVYETYDYHTKSWYWWTGRDKSTNCFEIRKRSNKFNLIVNESFNSDYEKFENAFEAMKSMYDNGKTEKKFRILRK